MIEIVDRLEGQFIDYVLFDTEWVREGAIAVFMFEDFREDFVHPDETAKEMVDRCMAIGEAPPAYENHLVKKYQSDFEFGLEKSSDWGAHRRPQNVSDRHFAITGITCLLIDANSSDDQTRLNSGVIKLDRFYTIPMQCLPFWFTGSSHVVIRGSFNFTIEWNEREIKNPCRIRIALNGRLRVGK